MSKRRIVARPYARLRLRASRRARAELVLNGDPDEDPTGDAGRPICGECERSRNFDADLEMESR